MRPQLKALLAAKLRAFGIHLLASFGVFGLIFLITVNLWLPYPYFWIDGGIVVMVVAGIIDLFIGPLLTFVVYRPGRKRLFWNLAVIAALQAAALAWGVKVLYTARPIVSAYIGYTRREFFPIPANLVVLGPRSIEALQALSPERPALLYLSLPKNFKQARRLVESAFAQGSSVFRETDRLMPVKGAALEEVLAAGRSIAELAKIWPDAGPRVDAYLADSGRKIADVALIPLYGRYSSALLVLDRGTGRLVGHIYLHAR